MMIRSAARVVMAAAAVLLGGCQRKCGIVSSTVVETPVLNGAGTYLGTLNVLLRQEAGPTAYYLAAGVSSLSATPLAGHLLRARLVSEAGETLADLDTHAVGGSLARVELRFDYGRFVAYRDALLTSRARLVVDTDLAGSEHLEVVLRDVSYQPHDPSPCPGL